MTYKLLNVSIIHLSSMRLRKSHKAERLENKELKLLTLVLLIIFVLFSPLYKIVEHFDIRNIADDVCTVFGLVIGISGVKALINSLSKRTLIFTIIALITLIFTMVLNNFRKTRESKV